MRPESTPLLRSAASDVFEQSLPLLLPAPPFPMATETTEITETTALRPRFVVPLPQPPADFFLSMGDPRGGGRGTQIRGRVQGSVLSVVSVAYLRWGGMALRHRGRGWVAGGTSSLIPSFRPQHLHRIDSCGASGGNVTRSGRHHRQDGNNRNKNAWIGDTDFVDE